MMYRQLLLSDSSSCEEEDQSQIQLMGWSSGFQMYSCQFHLLNNNSEKWSWFDTNVIIVSRLTRLEVGDAEVGDGIGHWSIVVIEDD
jgi:hypothetical protein